MNINSCSIDKLIKEYELDSSRVDAAGSLIWELYLTKRMDDARAWADRFVTEHPDNVSAWRFRALLFSETGNLAEEQAALLRALEISPERSDVMCSMAWSLNRSERLQDAKHWAEKAICAAPKSTQGWSHLAAICCKMGGTDEEEWALKQAIELNNDSGQLYYRLALNLFKQRKILAAIEAAKVACIRMTSNEQYSAFLADLLVEIEDYAEAKEVLSRSFQTDLGVLVRLINVMAHLGNTHEARKLAATVLSSVKKNLPAECYSTVSPAIDEQDKVQKVAFLGNSHIWAIKNAWEKSAQSKIQCSFTIRRSPFLELTSGVELRRVSQAASAGKLFLSVGGGAYIELGFFPHPRPFDFILESDPTLPLQPKAELIPSPLIEQALRSIALKMLIELGFFASLSEGENVFCLQPPPPIHDNNYITTRSEMVFDKALQGSDISPPMLRLKLWLLYSEIIRKHCDVLGCRFVPVPVEMCDSRGFMIPDAYGSDGFHANEVYGAAVIRQVEAIVRDEFLDNGSL